MELISFKCAISLPIVSVQKVLNTKLSVVFNNFYRISAYNFKHKANINCNQCMFIFMTGRIEVEAVVPAGLCNHSVQCHPSPGEFIAFARFGCLKSETASMIVGCGRSALALDRILIIISMGFFQIQLFSFCSYIYYVVVLSA